MYRKIQCLWNFWKNLISSFKRQHGSFSRKNSQTYKNCCLILKILVRFPCYFRWISRNNRSFLIEIDITFSESNFFFCRKKTNIEKKKFSCWLEKRLSKSVYYHLLCLFSFLVNGMKVSKKFERKSFMVSEIKEKKSKMNCKSSIFSEKRNFVIIFHPFFKNVFPNKPDWVQKNFKLLANFSYLGFYI